MTSNDPTGGTTRAPSMSQADKARLFHSLHTGGRVLVLANAWDAASARLVEEAGAAAIATTSAGVAWSLGFPDGDRLPRDLALGAVARVAAAVRVPVSADIESGFAPDAEGVAETARGVLDAGAVGINLEDSDHTGGAPLLDVQRASRRVAAARRAADEFGVPLYVNARTDTYLRQVGDPATRLQDTLARAEAYLAAGADGIFVPGVVRPDAVSALVEGIPAPLNILVGPGAPSIGELAGLGVARISVGSSISLAAYAVAWRSALELFDAGTYGALAGKLDYGELNAILARTAVE